MNLYKKLLENQNIENEKKRLYINKKSLEYYYRNREYVLLRQSKKKLLNSIYYKNWYDKNKIELIQRRNEKNISYTGAEKRLNKIYNTKSTIYNNDFIKKKPNFTIHF